MGNSTCVRVVKQTEHNCCMYFSSSDNWKHPLVAIYAANIPRARIRWPTCPWHGGGHCKAAVMYLDSGGGGGGVAAASFGVVIDDESFAPGPENYYYCRRRQPLELHWWLLCVRVLPCTASGGCCCGWRVSPATGSRIRYRSSAAPTEK